MFNIAFTPGMKNDLGYELGHITLGSLREGFRSSLNYWNIAQYETHWHNAITRLVNGAEYSALITDLPPSSPNDVIDWWPMWRDGNTVYVQEHLLIPSEVKGIFDPADPYKHVGSRQISTDDRERTSEWVVPLQDFIDFLQSNPNKA